jgi:4-hydroxybenzoate polyprenyltransferase
MAVRFTGERFKLRVHGTYALLWVCGAEAVFALAGGTSWTPDGGTVLRVFTVTAMLLYLRTGDELIDADHDRAHHPDRPLARGSVTPGVLHGLVAVIAVVVIAANVVSSPAAAAVLAADMAYGVLLLRARHRLAGARRDPFAGLALGYPVQLGVSVYLGVSASAGTGPTVVAALLTACAFLHFEFARKTRWAHGEQLYSSRVGPRASALLVVGAAVLACGGALALCAPWRHDGLAAVVGWLPLLPVALATAPVHAFRTQATRVWPAGGRWGSSSRSTSPSSPRPCQSRNQSPVWCSPIGLIKPTFDSGR